MKKEYCWIVMYECDRKYCHDCKHNICVRTFDKKHACSSSIINFLKIQKSSLRHYEHNMIKHGHSPSLTVIEADNPMFKMLNAMSHELKDLIKMKYE